MKVVLIIIKDSLLSCYVKKITNSTRFKSTSIDNFQSHLETSIKNKQPQYLKLIHILFLEWSDQQLLVKKGIYIASPDTISIIRTVILNKKY